ncbi:MAG: hypothetical protein ACOX2A_03360 [Tepidanaerobacteraceae bacterium]
MEQVIEEGALIGAGALVAQGKHIPSNSLVMGMPGRVIKSLSVEQIEMIKNSAINYARLAEEYGISDQF